MLEKIVDLKTIKDDKNKTTLYIKIDFNFLTPLKNIGIDSVTIKLKF